MPPPKPQLFGGLRSLSPPPPPLSSRGYCYLSSEKPARSILPFLKKCFHSPFQTVRARLYTQCDSRPSKLPPERFSWCLPELEIGENKSIGKSREGVKTSSLCCRSFGKHAFMSGTQRVGMVNVNVNVCVCVCVLGQPLCYMPSPPQYKEEEGGGMLQRVSDHFHQ